MAAVADMPPSFDVCYFRGMLTHPLVVAPHCGKCRQMMPFVKELSEEFPEVTFAKFDTTGEMGALGVGIIVVVVVVVVGVAVSCLCWCWC